MTVYSRFAALINGVERGVDLSTNTLNVGALEISGCSLSQAGVFATYVGTPAGASTQVTITANNPGTVGDVTLTFSGSNTIADEIATWNGANPGNMVTLTSGVGTQTPSTGTISLTGGSSVSGSSLIGNMNVYTNFTPTAATIAGALLGIDSALAGVSGSAITSLTGDVTASGPGAAVATLATVNTDVGSYALATVTVNAKGLVTAASAASTTGTGDVVLATSPTLVTPALGTPSALVGTNITGTAASLTAGTVTTNANLTGDVTSVGNATTLAATTNATLTTLSGLTTAGSLAISGSQVSGGTFGAIDGSALTNLAAANLSGVLPVGVTGGSGLSIATSQLTGSVDLTSQVSGILPVANGGTGAATLTLDGVLYGNGTSAVGITAAGTDGQVLTAHTGSAPTWADPATSGTVTSVALADASTAPIYSISGSPVTNSGTLTLTLTTQAANKVLAGPTTGSAVEPTFRALVVGDLSFAGSANGIATLDSGGKIPVGQLPNGVFTYQGLYDPSTSPSTGGTPSLVDGVGIQGQVYYISAAYNGIVTGAFGGASLNFSIGDLAIYNGTQWELTTPAAGVSSVNGAYGAVVMSMATANGFAGTYSGTALTVSTTITGLLKGNGTAISAATAGTDYVIPSGSITGTAGNITATTNSTLTTLSSLSLPGTQVTGNISGDAANVTGTVAIANGGTGQTTASAAFDALSPMTTGGDLIYGGASGTGTRLANGTAGQVLTSAGTTLAPTWADPAAPTSAPAVITTVVAGQAFAANTTYAVRWDMSSKTETTGRVYAADQDTTAPSDLFWVVGVISGGASGVAIGDSIPMTSLGMWTLGSSDGTFAATGVPVWLTSAGAFSLTAPTTNGYACTKIGMVQSSSQMWISPQVLGIN